MKKIKLNIFIYVLATYLNHLYKSSDFNQIFKFFCNSSQKPVEFDINFHTLHNSVKFCTKKKRLLPSSKNGALKKMIIDYHVVFTLLFNKQFFCTILKFLLLDIQYFCIIGNITHNHQYPSCICVLYVCRQVHICIY